MRRLVALVALMLAGTVGSAQAATVITFEDLALDSAGQAATGLRVDSSSTRPGTTLISTTAHGDQQRHQVHVDR